MSYYDVKRYRKAGWELNWMKWCENEMETFLSDCNKSGKERLRVWIHVKRKATFESFSYLHFGLHLIYISFWGPNGHVFMYECDIVNVLKRGFRLFLFLKHFFHSCYYKCFHFFFLFSNAIIRIKTGADLGVMNECLKFA